MCVRFWKGVSSGGSWGCLCCQAGDGCTLKGQRSSAAFQRKAHYTIGLVRDMRQPQFIWYDMSGHVEFSVLFHKKHIGWHNCLSWLGNWQRVVQMTRWAQICLWSCTLCLWMHFNERQWFKRTLYNCRVHTCSCFCLTRWDNPVFPSTNCM